MPNNIEIKIDKEEFKKKLDIKDGLDGSPDSGVEIVEKINEVPETGAKIDASHIKNLTSLIQSGGSRLASFIKKKAFTEGSVLFRGENKVTEDNDNLFWDDTNNRLGVGTKTPTKTLEVDGEIRATGDINASTNGSSTAVPRVFGYKDLTSGEACRFQFGDKHNGFQNGYAQDTTIYAYWGLVLRGGRQDYNAGFDAPPFTKTTDTGVLIISDNDIGDDPGEGATNIVTLGIKAVLNQTNNLTEWRQSDGTVLSSVNASGHFGIGNASPDEKLEVTGNVRTTTDNDKYYSGTAKDMSMYYDGTDGFIKTDEVAASDLHITTGAQKTMELDTVVWDDVRTPASTVKLSGAKPPTETAYKGSMVLSFPTNADKTIYFAIQLPHAYKEGEDIDFHIHSVIPTSGAGGGAENIKWDFTYSWANIGDVIPAETTINKTIDVQNRVADTHKLDEISTSISGTGKTISSQIICSLTRDVSVANDYADAVYVMEVDFHVPLNTIGSRQELIK